MAKDTTIEMVTAVLPSYEVRVTEALDHEKKHGAYCVDIINTDNGNEGPYLYVDAPSIYEALGKAVLLVPAVEW